MPPLTPFLATIIVSSALYECALLGRNSLPVSPSWSQITCQFESELWRWILMFLLEFLVFSNSPDISRSLVFLFLDILLSLPTNPFLAFFDFENSCILRDPAHLPTSLDVLSSFLVYHGHNYCFLSLLLQYQSYMFILFAYCNTQEVMCLSAERPKMIVYSSFNSQ